MILFLVKFVSKVKTQSREELDVYNFDFNRTAVSVKKSVKLDMQLERERRYFVEVRLG
jgi:hypothetical protein